MADPQGPPPTASFTLTVYAAHLLLDRLEFLMQLGGWRSPDREQSAKLYETIASQWAGGPVVVKLE